MLCSCGRRCKGRGVSCLTGLAASYRRNAAAACRQHELTKCESPGCTVELDCSGASPAAAAAATLELPLAKRRLWTGGGMPTPASGA
jgi:hypothetical protein